MIQKCVEDRCQVNPHNPAFDCGLIVIVWLPKKPCLTLINERKWNPRMSNSRNMTQSKRCYRTALKEKKRVILELMGQRPTAMAKDKDTSSFWQVTGAYWGHLDPSLSWMPCYILMLAWEQNFDILSGEICDDSFDYVTSSLSIVASKIVNREQAIKSSS